LPIVSQSNFAFSPRGGELIKATINALAAMTEGVAVTITLPTERHGENRAVGSHITRLFQQVEIALEERLNKRERRAFMNRLQKKIDSLDHNHLADGLWIGATTDAVFIHHLDDPVEPTVNVGDSLNLLPLARQSRRRGALVLLLTEKGCTLHQYKAADTATDRLRPITAEGFPFAFSGEGGRQARDAGSRQRDERYRHWLRRVANATQQAQHTIATVDDLPLVVVGIGRYIGFLAEVSPQLRFDVVIEASPDSLTAHDLDTRLTDAVASRFEDAAIAALGRAGRLTSTGRTATDVAEVAQLAAQGRVDVLIADGHSDNSSTVDQAVLDVLRHAGTVHVVEPGSIDAQLPELAPAQLVAILRW
jgi:hypothetical protein